MRDRIWYKCCIIYYDVAKKTPFQREFALAEHCAHVMYINIQFYKLKSLSYYHHSSLYLSKRIKFP